MRLNLHDPRQRIALAGGGGILVALVLHKRAAAAAGANTASVGPLFDPSSTQADLTGSGVTTGLPGGLSGDYGSGSIPVTTPTGPAPGDTSGFDWTTVFGPITDAASTLRDAVSTLTDPGTASARTDQAPQPAAPKVAEAPASAPPAGIWWGGTFMTSVSQLLGFERSHGNSNFDLAAWAMNHPAAARTLGVTPPPARPVSTPSASAPVPAAPTSGVARTTPPPPDVANPVPYYDSPNAGPEPKQTLAYEVATGVAAGGPNSRGHRELAV